MDQPVIHRETKLIFQWMAWLSPLTSLITICFSLYLANDIQWEVKDFKQGDRPSYNAAKQKRNQSFEPVDRVIKMGAAISGLFAIISLCGIRTRRGAAIIVPGVLIGLGFEIVLMIALISIFLITGIKY